MKLNYGSLALFAVILPIVVMNFCVQAKASTLVTTGLYSRIRNPIYVFGSLTVAGFLLWVKLSWLLLFFVILLPLQVYRSRKEALVLAEKFGSSYLNYKRQTWF
jgi:protein-S-isoprenylcysteine O-methyltransferase Ste14